MILQLLPIAEILCNKHLSSQWAFGVTVWELFTCGRVPYSGISVMSVLRLLKAGQRLDKPENTACSNEMLVAEFQVAH